MKEIRLSHLKQIIKRALKRIYYRGNKYVCPICNSELRTLTPIGRESILYTELQIIGAGLRYAGCGVCGSTDKERLLFIYLKNLIENSEFTKKIHKVLHVAPELSIKNLLNSSSNIIYRAGDYFAEGYSYPSDVEHLNIENTGFNDNSFDLIVCCHVLEHVNDDQRAINELFRILNYFGTAILQVPISMIINDTIEIEDKRSSLLNLHLYGQEDHLRLYGRDYFEKLKNAGFEVEFVNVSNDVNYGLNKHEFLIIARKNGK